MKGRIHNLYGERPVHFVYAEVPWWRWGRLGPLRWFFGNGYWSLSGYVRRWGLALTLTMPR